MACVSRNWPKDTRNDMTGTSSSDNEKSSFLISALSRLYFHQTNFDSYTQKLECLNNVFMAFIERKDAEKSLLN